MFYVAPDGDDANPGSEAKPYASMQKAQAMAAAGDTVYFRAGTYAFKDASAANGVVLDKSGQSGKRINYWAYQGEVPIFDFTGMTAATRITGLRVSASWIHVKGIELKGVPQNITTEHESWCIYNTGSNNIYELLNLHHNMGPGLFIAKGGENLVLNCDSHHNYDPKSSSGDGTNADGFGCHAQAGAKNNVFRGCRAWWNTDDGYDLIQAQEPVIIENSWAWKNGYQPDTMTAKADGNGFKGGGYGLPPTNQPAMAPVHIIRHCLAFDNRASGFYANHHPGPDQFYGNTAFKNRSAEFNMMGLDGNVGILRDNLAYGPTPLANGSGVDAKSNSWDLQLKVADADFMSVDPSGVDGPRQADGSLPEIPFMKLKAGSALIDKGEDIGLPFAGAAPDLGAFEFGAPTVVPAAGVGGRAGQAGVGQAGVGQAGMLAAGGGGGAGARAAGGGRQGVAGIPGSAPRGGAGGVAPVQPVAAGAGSGAAGLGVGVIPSAEAAAGGPSASGARGDSGCGCRAAGGRGGNALGFGAGLIVMGWRLRRRLGGSSAVVALWFLRR